MNISLFSNSAHTKWSDLYIKTISENTKINDSIYCEAHHITPRWWFRRNNIKVDETKNNLVRLPYKTHILVHFYLCKHFCEIKDQPNFCSAYFALKMMLTDLSAG